MVILIVYIFVLISYLTSGYKMNTVTPEERFKFLKEAKVRTDFRFEYIDKLDITEIEECLNNYSKNDWISKGIIQKFNRVQENVDFLMIIVRK